MAAAGSGAVRGKNLAGAWQGAGTARLTHLPEESRVPVHGVGVGSLHLGVKRANHVVEHLHPEVISPHTGARTPRELVCALKNLKGPEPGGRAMCVPRQT